MVQKITEQQFADLKRKASRHVQFHDARVPVSSRRATKRRSRKARAGGQIPWLALTVMGGIAALGYASYRENNLHGLGDAADGQIGGQIGSVLGSISGIPGVGAIGSLIGGLLGPSAHYTPSGMLYDTASKTLKSNAVELAELTNELYARIGRPYRIPIPVWAPVGSSNVSTIDDPKLGPYLATLLNNPSFRSATTPDALIALQSSGVYDNAIQLQEHSMTAIETALNGLDDQSLIVVAGRVVPAASPSSYQGTQEAAAPASTGTSLMTWISANPALAIGGAVVLVLLLRR
jgi:hypothetical protein